MKFKELFENKISVDTCFKKASVFAPFGFAGYSKRKLEKLYTKTTLKINVIEPTQEDVLQSGIDYYVKNPPKEIPLVVFYMERYFAINHTRICAQAQKKKTIDVNVIGYDGKDYYKI